MHPQGGSDPVQRVPVVVGDQDGLDGLDRLAGDLGGDQLGGQPCGLPSRIAGGGGRGCIVTSSG